MLRAQTKGRRDGWIERHRVLAPQGGGLGFALREAGQGGG